MNDLLLRTWLADNPTASSTPTPTPTPSPSGTPDFSYLATLPTWLAATVVVAAVAIPILSLFAPTIREALATRQSRKHAGQPAPTGSPSAVLAQSQDRTDEYIRYLRTENETLRVELGEMRRQIKGLEDEIDRLNKRLWRGPDT